MVYLAFLYLCILLKCYSWILEQVFRAELKEGDTIVMGSDGLFDNVYDLEIENTLRIFTISDQESAQRCGGCFTSLL